MWWKTVETRQIKEMKTNIWCFYTYCLMLNLGFFSPCTSIGWISYLQNKEDYWGNVRRISSLTYLFLNPKNSNNLSYFFRIWKLKIFHGLSCIVRTSVSYFWQVFTIWFNPLLNSKVWISLMVRVLHPKNCKVLSNIENTIQNLCCLAFFTSF